jgi:ligand-binding SRPBCC domain-containing protein
MGCHILEQEAFLPRPRPEIFSFFADAANLDRVTPPWLAFRIVTPTPVAMAPGTLIDYRLRLRGVPIRWRTEITVWEPPHRFVDTQVRGPYRRWVHEHRFAEVPGGTQMVDRVEYALPFGFLGRLAHRLFVGRDVARIFAYREEAFRRLFPPRARG